MSEHTRPFSRRAFVGTAAAFGISLCLPPLMPAKAHAVTAAEKQAEANAALEKLNAMQEKLDRAEVSLYAAETERDDAQARMTRLRVASIPLPRASASCRTSWARVPATCTATDPRASSISSWVPPRSKSSPRIGIFSTR